MDKRLKSKKQIDRLFETGNSLFVYPVKLVFSKEPKKDDSFADFLYGVSVSKRNFKRAVDRNRLKRQMREAIRRQISLFVFHQHWEVRMMFIYVGKTMLDYQMIEKAIRKLSHHFK